MVVSQTQLANTEAASAQDLQDTASHGAVSTDGTEQVPSDTTMTGEVFRDVVDAEELTSNDYTGTFIVGANEANGNTIRKGGLFDSSSGANLLLSDVFPETDKTNDTELFLDFNTVFSATEDTT